MISKILKGYFNITASILILFTLIGILDNIHRGNKSIISYLLESSLGSYSIVFIFGFCFINMFILFAAGIIYAFQRKNIKSSLFYILSALFFLIFFMGFSDWDRF